MDDDRPINKYENFVRVPSQKISELRKWEKQNDSYLRQQTTIETLFDMRQTESRIFVTLCV